MTEKRVFRTKAVTESSAYSTTPASPGKTEGDLEGIGVLRQIGDYLYRWVQNTHNAELVVGDVVFHNPADGDDMIKYVEDCFAAPGISFMAGVVVSTSIAAATADGLTTGGFGWIMIEGHTTAYMLPGTTAGDVMAAGGSCVGAAATKHIAWGDIITVATPSNYQRHLVLTEDLTTHTTPANTLTACWVACRG